MNIEIFVGRRGKILQDGAIFPYETNDYSWFGKGVHHKDALAATGKNGLARIVPNTKVTISPPDLGFYKAKIEVYNPEFPNNSGWKVKNSKGGFSTFFPDSWNRNNYIDFDYYYHKKFRW